MVIINKSNGLVDGFLITAKNRDTTTQLYGDISFKGDARSFLEFEAPPAQVMEWLTTPSASDLTLLGCKTATRQAGSGLWECLQPRIDFMGLDIQPCFYHDLQRKSTSSSSIVIVEVVDSKTNILNDSPANQVVASLMERAKFSGKSIISSRKVGATQSRLDIDLTLNLHVPLPPLVLIPPGFNSIGSTLVKRTSTARTKKLLEDLKSSYLQWEKGQQESTG